MKKLFTFLMCITLLLNICPNAFAYSYPNAFWTANDKYKEALTYNNHNQIIEYGNKIINIMSGAANGAEKTDILITRYHNVGLSYAAIGDYENSAKTFEKLYNYAKPYENDDKYYNYVKGAKERVKQYMPSITMYTDKGASTYYGAKNEKKNGVLFGLCSNGVTRSKLKNESMVIVYQELGHSLIAYNTDAVKKASAAGIAVEFALNCPNEGRDIQNIKNMNSYLKEISDMLSKYSNIPIYLRFAAEFDIWQTPTTPDAFKEAFRYVSNYFKSRNSNVAIVWSPNQVSSWNVDIDDYYPGDEYVDWVGISLYAQKYFYDDNSEDSELFFRTGKNSDPVIAVKDIVEKYGNRKPIMISECGCGHKITSTGENATDFALLRLKEYFSYLPMVYPQIKLMGYFDWYVEGSGEKNDFRLSSNSTLQNEYLRLTKGSRFIQNGYNGESDFCYRPVYNGIGLDGIFEVSCYAHSYGKTIKNVIYSIDNNYVGSSNEVPYTAYIDATAYTGNHTLKAIATFNDGSTLSTQSNVNISHTNKDISVEISNNKVLFDQEPIIFNDRTMVPMRKIFESLGATVSWDDSTKTATGTRGDRAVKVSVGQKTMNINNKTVVLDTAPIVLSGRTLVPVRAVAEGLGCTVDWKGNYNLVSITPKVFSWSGWVERLPNDVDDDLFYIEKKTQYSYRTREKEEFTLDTKIRSGNYVREDVSYGEWSDWQRERISENENREVKTRTKSEPKMYHYAHYCTGYNDDESLRYKTSNRKFSDLCSYHNLGWYDYELPTHPDGVGHVVYLDNGNFYRCSNSCFRWYLVDTTGGNYTEYSYRDVYHKYIYWEWTDWSRWSDWKDNIPYDYYDTYGGSVEIDERTIYRYKEK